MRERDMEETIAIFSKSVATFCTHLESSCDALKRSLDRRPVPLDSASSTFLQCLNRRVSDTTTELSLLDSMALGTVSFEELLGHCNEVYKKNQSDLLLLEDRLKSFGYVPEIDMDDCKDESPEISTPCLDSNDDLNPPPSIAKSFVDTLEADSLMDESFSLKKLGLSDVCLATLASEANAKIDDSDFPSREPIKLPDIRTPCPTIVKKSTGAVEGQLGGDPKAEAPRSIVEISKNDYERQPSYIKGLTSWEDLLNAVDKINSGLQKKQNMKGSDYFHQDEIASLDLGPKARSYLLLLVRMNRLIVETIDGLISYKVVSVQKQ